MLELGLRRKLRPQMLRKVGELVFVRALEQDPAAPKPVSFGVGCGHGLAFRRARSCALAGVQPVRLDLSKARHGVLGLSRPPFPRALCRACHDRVAIWRTAKLAIGGWV